MDAERLKLWASGSWSADDRAPGFEDIVELASALLAAQKRVAELEEIGQEILRSIEGIKKNHPYFYGGLETDFENRLRKLLGQKSLEDNLRQVEDALRLRQSEIDGYECRYPAEAEANRARSLANTEALQALASLRSLLSGDEGGVGR